MTFGAGWQWAQHWARTQGTTPAFWGLVLLSVVFIVAFALVVRSTSRQRD